VRGDLTDRARGLAQLRDAVAEVAPHHHFGVD
jgi:hypothetical protein